MARARMEDAVHPVGLQAYYEDLRAARSAPALGAPGTLWQRHEGLSMARFPPLVMSAPSRSELRSVMWRRHAAVATYLASPTPERPANSVLYLIAREDLPLALSPEARRNVRRAESELAFEFVSIHTLRAWGLQAFCETRQRNHLSDGTAAGFERHLVSYDRAGQHILAAWHGDDLVAYLALTVVEDLVLVGSYSATSARRLRPNDGLIHTAVEYFLAGGRCRTMSFGLSSLQGGMDHSGLHRFKLNVGFRPVPVTRTFVLHPILRPLVNRHSVKGVDALLARFPRSRPLRKAGGVLHKLV